jgi:hypothetical protein
MIGWKVAEQYLKAKGKQVSNGVPRVFSKTCTIIAWILSFCVELCGLSVNEWGMITEILIECPGERRNRCHAASGFMLQNYLASTSR